MNPIRSRRLLMFFKIDVLKNFANYTGKHLCWILIKLQFLIERLQHRCFPAIFANVLKNTFFHGTPPVAASVWWILYCISREFNWLSSGIFTVTLTGNSEQFRSSRRQSVLSKKKLFLTFHKIDRRTSVSESLFNKVATWSLQLCSKSLQNRCFSLHYEKLSKTSFFI